MAVTSLKPTQKVRKKDYQRILLTETCPYETPVIFDNFGLYKHITNIQKYSEDIKKLLTQLLTDDKEPRLSIPFIYNIRKDFESPRTLSLIHPRSQIHFIEFYKKFDEQVLLCCKKSKFSLRAPLKVTSKYYVKNAQENIRKYRSNNIASASSELKDRYLTTYFAYGENTRLYKFFESLDYLGLEKQYSHFWSIDVSKCFDSIYTHSITWAIKTKEYTKRHINIEGVFGDIFDLTIRNSNYNETAGIPIGPEISRIFAEIIFQDIDEKIEKKLDAYGLKFETHYSIRRYVDDFFIFSNSEYTCNKIFTVIESECKAYKLNINEAKTVKAQRPFITAKTKALRSAQRRLSALKESLFEGEDYSSPRQLSNQKTLTLHFIDDIKSACSEDPDSYQLISAYVVGWLSNRVISTTDDNINRTDNLSGNSIGFSHFFNFSIRIIFHFYSINPSHRSSVKLCTAVKLACTFYEKHLPDEIDDIKMTIYRLCKEFFSSGAHLETRSTDTDVSLIEAMNILVLSKELGSRYLLPEEALEGIAKTTNNEPLNYFEIVTLLYYIRNENIYSKIRSKVDLSISHHLSDLSDIRLNSHKSHLLMDVLSCPYVDYSLRCDLVSNVYKTTLNHSPGRKKIGELMSFFESSHWFVNWRTFDLLTVLEKKELLSGY